MFIYIKRKLIFYEFSGLHNRFKYQDDNFRFTFEMGKIDCGRCSSS